MAEITYLFVLAIVFVAFNEVIKNIKKKLKLMMRNSSSRFPTYILTSIFNYVNLFRCVFACRFYFTKHKLPS